MDLGLDGRVAVVGAASRGLGRAVAEALAGEGAHLVIAARGQDDLDAVKAHLESGGTEVVAVACDVIEPGVPGDLVELARERFGRIDVVVANSGGPPFATAFEFDDDQLHAAIEANLLTHVRFARAALPAMRDTGWGRICCIASYGVIQPIPTLALSNAARTGLRAWAKTAAGELRGSGVTLNLACPGLHRTERIARLGDGAGPIGEPADFGKVVAFMCSEPAAYLNGAIVVVDGGSTVAL